MKQSIRVVSPSLWQFFYHDTRLSCKDEENKQETIVNVGGAGKTCSHGGCWNGTKPDLDTVIGLPWPSLPGFREYTEKTRV